MMFIKNIKIVVYAALRQKMKRPHTKIVKYIKSNPQTEIWDIEFPEKSLGDACFRDDNNTKLANPKSKLAIWFVSNTSSYGLKPACWYIMVNNRIFKRITYKDIGIRGAKSGLVATRDGHIIMYLSPIKISKEDRIKVKENIDMALAEIYT